MAAGLSQGEVAKRCNKKGNSWISQLERGTFPRSLDDVMLLAAALEVSPLWLLTGLDNGSDVVAGGQVAIEVLAPPENSLRAMWPRDIPQFVGVSGKRHFLLWAEVLVNPVDAPIRHGLLLCERMERRIPRAMPSVTLGRRGYYYEAANQALAGRTGHVVVGMVAAPTKRWRPEPAGLDRGR